ncbi:MAG: ABC transporter substrate-binding protein, partial [Vallitaleaceae bacterium]|nr:ABC transporter substrate-binding protein [Vallitaleaceae bacterium]
TEDIVAAQALFSNVNARKAVAMAFDKSYITDLILGNGSLPTDYLVPLGLSTDANGDDFRAAYPDGWNHFDVAMAQEYWATALSELGITEISIELLTYDSDSSKKISEYIQGQLESNLPGLTVTLNQQPFENKLALAEQGQFELQFAGWGPDYPDPMTFLDMWISGSGHNDAGYSSDDYDSMIAASKTGELATKYDERWTTLQEAEALLIGEDAVLIPLYQRSLKIVQREYVEGIIAHTFGGDYTFKRATTTQTNDDGLTQINLPDSSDIPSMNTSLATDSVSFQAAANVLEGLVMLGENDVVEPGVAESWDISADGLNYTFHLREDAVWSNGDPVTADDFVYAFQKLADPATGSQYNFMIETASIANGAAVMAGEAGVEELGITAVDAQTLEIQLEIAVPYFIKVMAFPSFYPLNQAFVEEQGDLFGTSPETTLYNGAFVLSKWEIGLTYEYAKNDTYWDADATTVDVVNFRIVKDTNTAVNMYETGEIDRVGLDADNLPAYLDDPNLFDKSDTVSFYLVFNINNNDQY